MKVFKRFLTEAEQRQLLRHMHLMRADALARRDGALMRLFLHGGTRLGETLLISTGDALAALRAGWLYIPKAHRKGKGMDHQVLVTAPVREALRDLLSARAEITGVELSRETDPLIVGRHGRAMTARAVQLRFAQWCQAAGMPDGVSPHWFRHTRAKNIMRKSTSNDPRGIVQAALGHASIGSTGIYTTVSHEELADELNRIDGAGDRRKVKRDLKRDFQGRVA